MLQIKECCESYNATCGWGFVLEHVKLWNAMVGITRSKVFFLFFHLFHRILSWLEIFEGMRSTIDLFAAISGMKSRIWWSGFVSLGYSIASLALKNWNHIWTRWTSLGRSSSKRLNNEGKSWRRCFGEQGSEGWDLWSTGGVSLFVGASSSWLGRKALLLGKWHGLYLRCLSKKRPCRLRMMSLWGSQLKENHTLWDHLHALVTSWPPLSFFAFWNIEKI